MLYKNAMLFLPDRGFVPGAFRVENGLFRDVGTPAPTGEEPGTRWALWKTASWRTSLSAGRIFLSGRSISRTARCTGCDLSPGNRIAILPGW